MKKAIFTVENFEGRSISVKTTYNIKCDAKVVVSVNPVNEFKDTVTIQSEEKMDVVVTVSITYSEPIKNVDRVNMIYVLNEDGRLIFAGSEEIKKVKIG